MTATDTQPSVNPSGVLIDNTITQIGEQKIPDPPKKVFALQTEAWGALQMYIANSLQLPVLKSDFEDRYGTFKDEDLVEQGITYLKKLQDATNAFGDVITESQDIIKYIGTDDPPKSLYAKAIWLASKIESTAMNVSNMAKSAIPALEKETDPDKRAEDIKQLLTYPNYGMYTHAVDLNKKSLDFKGELGTYLDGTFTPAKNAFDDYFNNTEDTILSDAQDIVAEDAKTIKKLTDKAADLNKQLLGWAIGGSVGTVVASVMPPLFIFGGAILGGVEIYECIKLKAEIDELNSEISTYEDDKKKKSTLVADLNNLLDSSQKVTTAAGDFLSAVTQMATGFGLCATDMKTISDAVTPSTVENLPPFLQNTGLESAESDWEEVQVAANNFLTTGQYKYKTDSGS